MNHLPFARSLGFGLASLCLSSALRGEDPYVIGGPAASLVPGSGSYAWDGSSMADYRAALENPSNFGPGGNVETTVQTRTLTTITRTKLASLDAFVAAHWDDADLTEPQIEAILEFWTP